MSRKVWVVCHATSALLDAQSMDLLRQAMELGTDTPCSFSLILFGEKVETVPAGFESVVYCESRLDVAADALARHLVAYVKKEKPDIILACANEWGRCIMSVAAALLETGLTADCTRLGFDEEGNLLQVRPAFGGSILAQIITPVARPQMATVHCSVVHIVSQNMVKPNIYSLNCMSEVVGARLINEAVEKTVKDDNLLQKKIVVAGGMGVGSQEGFEIIHEIAQALGAGVVASRAAVNAGYAPYSCQVGQSGKSIMPDIYIALGISGAVQHLAGIRSARKIIAVNEDAKAQIFNHADIAIVCDWKIYAEQLLQAIKSDKR